MPAAATMSGSTFDALPPDKGRRWELMEGKLIKVSSPTPRHQRIAFRVHLELERFLAADQATVLGDVEFALAEDVRLRPDVCVLLGDKSAHLNPDLIPIPGAPDIAIEIISPTERASDSLDKVQAYLRNGVVEVWQMYPRSGIIQVHQKSGTHVSAPDARFQSSLLPGFSPLTGSLFT